MVIFMKENNSPFINVDDLPKSELGNVKFYAEDNGKIIKDVFLNCFDIVVKNGVCGDRRVVFAKCDGLTSSEKIIEGITKPMLHFSGELPKKDVLKFISSEIICGTEVKTEKNLDLAIENLLRGCVLVFVDGVEECIVVGMQNIPGRSIDEPNYEVQENGSREGFVEILKTNMTLVRKRLVNVNFKIEVLEADKPTVVKILMGTYPKFEKQLGVKLNYTDFQKERIFKFLVSMTTEYNRVYEIASRYPDVCLTLISSAFSYAVFENAKEVKMKHIYKAIVNANNIYPDAKKKEVEKFKIEFKDMLDAENVDLTEIK